ncbi:ferrous iron transport protein A [Deefgea tanakiae]|uniref:Ferrous iron transport protein A n=1 Tax=Deefgea tanakiae TaxID=2865840 RepID=A0ABX8Z4A5_9NEIS|nr:FeoA family protein [Deefgea tanakiae]QZA77132.1 ferrous iron transport protein A [Deefgea tanakiae]
MNLAQIALGQSARVCALNIPAELAQRLAALGLRLDCEVTVLRRGWLGGPLQLRVGNTELMLRRDAAEGIEVLLVSDAMLQTCTLAEVAA